MPEEEASQEVIPEDAPSTPDASDTEAADSQEGTPAPADVNWQERYTNLQPEYTRASQEAAEYRQIIELARQGDAEALDWLGLEAADTEEDDDEYTDPEEQLRAELEEIKGRLSEQDEQAAEQELEQLEDQYLHQSLDALQNEHGKLSEKEQEAVINLAFSYPDQEGLPDVTAAYEALSAASKAAQDRYLESKKAPKVEQGAAGLDKVDLSNESERLKYMADLAEAEMSAE